MAKKIMIRTEALAQANVGTGHLWREIFLANALRRRGARILFVLNGSRAAGSLLGPHRMAHVFLADGAHRAQQWKRHLQRWRPDLVVFDRWHNDPREIRAVQAMGAKIVLMDDERTAGNIADVRINGLLPSSLADYSGAKYVVMPPARCTRRGYARCAATLVCSFGGHDHHSLMRQTLAALAGGNPFKRIWCFCDTRYRKDPSLEKLKERLGPGVELFFGDPRLPRYLAKADMGLISGGLTLYQALAYGLPAVVIGQYPHQIARAQEFARQGILVHAGSEGKVDWKKLPALLERLKNSVSVRQRLGRRARKFVDGQGLSRVTKILLDLLKPEGR